MLSKENREKYMLLLHHLRKKVREFEEQLVREAPTDLPPYSMKLDVAKTELVFTVSTGLVIMFESKSPIRLAEAPAVHLVAAVGHLEGVKAFVEGSLDVQVTDLDAANSVMDFLLRRTDESAG